MPFRIITIPFDENKGAFFEDILNQFCLNKKVLSHKAEFFQGNNKAYWSVFIEYDLVLGDSKVDPESLNEPEKLLYNRLRQWRRGTAEKEGIPIFIIATNKILETLAIKKPVSNEALKEIKGFGKKKIEKYAEELTGIIQEFVRKD